MQLPFWLLNFEEIVEVLISDSSRKAEIEILQELIPIAKARYSAGRARDQQNFRRGMIEPSRFTVDTPVPYRISDLTGLIDERMGKLENKKDLSPYRQLRSRIDNISQDGRYCVHVRLAHRLRRHDAGARRASSACPSTTSRSPSSS